MQFAICYSKTASYPVRKFEEFEREDRLELVATFSPTSAVADELDAVTRELEKPRCRPCHLGQAADRLIGLRAYILGHRRIYRPSSLPNNLRHAHALVI